MLSVDTRTYLEETNYECEVIKASRENEVRGVDRHALGSTPAKAMRHMHEHGPTSSQIPATLFSTPF